MLPPDPVYGYLSNIHGLEVLVQTGRFCECDACLEDVYVDPLDEAREAEWPWYPE